MEIPRRGRFGQAVARFIELGGCATTRLRQFSVYDFGQTPDGQFYYAMDLLDGLDWHDLVDRYGAQPPSASYAFSNACVARYMKPTLLASFIGTSFELTATGQHRIHADPRS